MDDKVLSSFRYEKDLIKSKINAADENWDIREIQREELILLKKIIQQLQAEEATRDLSWEKNNLFCSISSLHHNIRHYPTLLGLSLTLTFIDNTLNEKGELNPDQLDEIKHANLALLLNYVNQLFYLVNGE